MQRFTIRFVAALTTFLIGLTTNTVLTAYGPADFSGSEVEQEVLSVEEQYKEAHVRRDVGALSRILADDFTLTYGGRFTTRAERLALIESAHFKFDSISTRGVRVQLSGDSAVVSGQAIVDGRYQGREYSSPWYGFTRSYEKRQGRWQVVGVRVTHTARR